MKKPLLSIDYTKEGKGVKKGSTKLFTFYNFFPLLKRKIWGLIKVNLLWIVAMFPLLFGFVALSGRFDFTFKTPADPLWAIFSGVEMFGQNPALSALMGTGGVQLSMSTAGPVAKVLYGITALAILTFGPANTGMAYVLRQYTKEEYVDMPGDFFSTIKKNFWQSLAVGIFDIIILVLFLFNLVFYATNSADYVFSVFFFICLILFSLYLMARTYLYLILVTFKLPTRKIFKNSIIFSIIGFKRNIVAFLANLVLILFNICLYVYALGLGGLMPFFITVSLSAFITSYAAWPNIKKVMIDPYYKSNDHVKKDDNTETIFTDRG